MISPIKNINFVYFKSNKLSKPKTPSVATTVPEYKINFGNDVVSKWASENPNTAFLYDKSLSYDERLKIVSQHPEIIDVADIAKDLNLPESVFASSSRFFRIEKLQRQNELTHNYIDTSYDINRANLDIITKNKDNIIAQNDYRNIMGLSPQYLTRLICTGKMKTLELYSRSTNELEPSQFVFVDDKEAIQIFHNTQKVGNKSDYFNKLLKFPNTPVYANILKLSRLGFGSPKTMFALIKSGKIDGKINSSNFGDKTKYYAYADLNSKKTERVLKELREKQCIELTYADNRFCLSEKEIFDSYCHNELDCYTDAVFIGDTDKIFIDRKSPKNANTFNKLLIQKELLNAVINVNRYNTVTCPRIKFAWYLMPKTREIVKKLAASDAAISDYIKRRYDTDLSSQYNNGVPIKPLDFCKDRASVDEIALFESKIEKTDIKNVRKFFEKVWELAGEEEYKEALIKADEMLSLNFDDIKDKELKNIFALSASYSNRDFLPLT